jgi:hypothetical protein
MGERDVCSPVSRPGSKVGSGQPLSPGTSHRFVTFVILTVCQDLPLRRRRNRSGSSLGFVTAPLSVWTDGLGGS